MSLDPLDIAAEINRLIPKGVDHDRERAKAKEAETFKALVQPSPNDVVIEPDDRTNGKRAAAGREFLGSGKAASCSAG
jgi:hypothetical protein